MKIVENAFQAKSRKRDLSGDKIQTGLQVETTQSSHPCFAAFMKRTLSGERKKSWARVSSISLSPSLQVYEPN